MEVAQRGYLPVLRSNNITDDGLKFDDLVYVREDRISPKQKLQQGDVVVAASSGSLDVVGKAADVRGEFDGAFGAFCKVLRPKIDRVDPRYFSHFFRTAGYRRTISALAAGANINNLKNQHLDQLELPVPPLDDQRRIAAILDKADVICRKRMHALALIDILSQSIFLEMFGDPAANPYHYRSMTFGEIALKMSDGPFGSNLKSEHYVASGVRVVRLQNIGVGKFLDEDRAYISDEHFGSLAKHECLPGDVLVGTLGDPNLRACLQPEWLKRAINKADCVQIRPNTSIALPEYTVALINQPSVERLAQGLMLGQTRTRISMGRLRDLAVPIAPIGKQELFAQIVQKIGRHRQVIFAAVASANALFSSLQHRAFAGESL